MNDPAHREALSALYTALFDIGELREAASTLGGQDAARLAKYLGALEARAMSLLEQYEPQQPFSH